MALVGILAGVAYPWLEIQAMAELSQTKMIFMLGFSTVTFTFMLTLYRILQRLFRKGIILEGRKIDFDERLLVRVIGLYWFIPFGLTLQAGTFNPAFSNPEFGKVMIIQGLVISLGAWLSRIIKK